jgi:Recombinase/Recombinase zinc beta ribbon domain/Resolvase, N terminal domain
MVEVGEVEAIYADAQDRLSRGRLAEWVNFKALCDDNGTRIVINGRELRADDEADEMLAAFEAMRARRESAEKSHRVRSGKAAAARAGRPNGGPRRFGFDQRDGQLFPRPDEIAVVERILREAVAGRSQSEIAAGLNADGHKTARGKAWNQSQVSQLVGDPIWIGVLRNKEGDHAIYEPFVPKELWDVAQKTRRGPDGPRRGRTTQRFLLGNGLLRCGSCGSAMIVRRERKPTGWYEVYICGGRSSGTHPDCTQRVVHRATVDSAVLAYFEQVGLDVESTRAELAERATRERAEIRALRGQAERELAKAEERLERVRRDYQDGKLDADDWAEQRVQLQDELTAARQDAERLALRDAEVTDDPGVLEDVELLTRLAELRSAIAGDVAGNPDDFAATHAALRRVFEAFHLRSSVARIALVGDSDYATDDADESAGGPVYVLEPVPRSDAVVLSEDGIAIRPVPLGLSSREGGSNASSRSTSRLFRVIRPVETSLFAHCTAQFVRHDNRSALVGTVAFASQGVRMSPFRRTRALSVSRLVGARRREPLGRPAAILR